MLIENEQRSTYSRNGSFVGRFAWPAILTLIFSSVFFIRLTGVNVIGQIDELYLASVVLFGFGIGVLTGRLNWLLGLYLFSYFLLTLISLLGGYDSSPLTSVLSTALFLKFFMLFYVFRHAVVVNFRPVIYTLFGFCCIGGAASFLMPSFFETLLPDTTYEIGVSRMLGFFVNSNRQGALACLLFLYFWFVAGNRYFAAAALLILFLSGSRTYLVLTVITHLYFLHSSGRKLSLYIIAPILAACASYLLVFEFNLIDTFEKVSGTLNSDLRYIRVAMFAGGVSLAAEFFPFGAGGGQFGSPLSVGSESYVSLGISHWSSVEAGTGIHDSGIGTILGEYGFLGFVTLGVLLFHGFSRWGAGTLKPVDLYFLIGLVALQSLFRQVISDFYFSFITIGIAVVLVRIRQGQTNAHPSRP